MRLSRSAAVLSALALALVVVPSASAAPEGVQCSGGTEQISINPGLVFGERPQQVSTAFTTNCAGPEIATASVLIAASGKGSCVPSLGVPSADMSGTVSWSNGTRSAFQGTMRLTLAGSQFNGVVTNGLFKGKRVSAIAAENTGDLPNVVAGCMLGGVQQLTGTVASFTVA